MNNWKYEGNDCVFEDYGSEMGIVWALLLFPFLYAQEEVDDCVDCTWIVDVERIGDHVRLFLPVPAEMGSPHFGRSWIKFSNMISHSFHFICLHFKTIISMRRTQGDNGCEIHSGVLHKKKHRGYSQEMMEDYVITRMKGETLR